MLPLGLALPKIKSGKKHRVSVHDRRLSRIVRRDRVAQRLGNTKSSAAATTWKAPC